MNWNVQSPFGYKISAPLPEKSTTVYEVAIDLKNTEILQNSPAEVQFTKTLATAELGD